MVTSIANCVLLVLKIKVDSDDQLVHFKSSKLLRESTFVDLDDLFNENGNFGIGFNMFDACEQKIVVSQGSNETPMLVSSTSTNIVRSVVDLLNEMSQIQHISNKLRSLDYATMRIETINFLPMNLTMTCLRSPCLQANGSFQIDARYGQKNDDHAWCKVKTANIKNSFGLGFQSAKCFGHLQCQNDSCSMFFRFGVCNEVN
jgi:hypothetical protein